MTDSGVRLIGGEMLKWSDEAGDSGRLPVRGAVLAELLTQVVPSGSRVLFAGPHDRALVRQVARRAASVTCLLRSLSDGSDLAGGPDDVEVWCGALDKLGGAGDFDVVIALDGLDRLDTPDSCPLGWREVLTRLAQMVVSGGRLVVAVENELGVHRLVEVDRSEMRQANQWWQLAGRWAADPAQLNAVLAEAGLPQAMWYVGYPRPGVPELLLDARAVAECVPGSVPARLLDAACSGDLGDRLLLGDPRELVAGAVRGSLADRIAPFWVVVADPSGTKLPGALVQEGGPDPRWAVVSSLEVDSGRWLRRPATEPAVVRTSGRVTRDPGRLTGRVPGGSSLEQQLLAACRSHDLPAIRSLLRGYAAWLAGQQAGDHLPGWGMFATFDNVANDRDRFALLDPGWAWTERVEPADALARVLRRFAIRLVESDTPRPWPSSLDVHELTRVLHAIVGAPADDRTLYDGIRLEAEIEATLRGEATEEQARLEASLVAGGPGAMLNRPRGYRELVAAHTLLSQELQHQRARAASAERQLRAVENQLDKVQGTLRAVRASASFRAGRVATMPLRRLRRLTR